MKLRTFRFYGAAFSNTDQAEIQVMFDQHVIFHSTIPVLPINQALTRNYSAIAYQLCACDLPVTKTGHIPLEISVIRGVLYFGDVYANYTFGHRDMWQTPNVSFNTLSLGKDCKRNININDKVQEPGIDHSWYYRLVEKQRMQCDIYYPPEQAILLVPPGYASGVNLSSADPLDL